MYYSKLFAISLMCFLLCNTLLCAQAADQAYTVKGKVLDKNGKSIENVSVELHNAKDSSVIKIVLTDNKGLYLFENLHVTKCFVSLSSIGFQPVHGEVFHITNQATTLPDMLLSEAASNVLRNVVVTANKPLLEYRAGKIVMNVESSPTNAGSSALELLEKAPGVNVNQDGDQLQINLRGKPGVSIFIDGKPIYVSGAELINLLSTMQASDIDKIEIASNGAAKYDATGTGGVINIKTKKMKMYGFNGTLNSAYSQGIYPKTKNGLSFNYRGKRINMYGNVAYSYNKEFRKLDKKISFYTDDKTDIIGVVKARWKNSYSYHTPGGKLGIDYTLNKKHSIGIVASMDSYMRDGYIPSASNIINADGLTTSIVESVSSGKMNYHNNVLSANYQGTISNTGATLSIDGDYAYYNTSTNFLLSAHGFDTLGNSMGVPNILDGKSSNSIRIYSAKADFVYPFNKNTKLELGIKGSNIEVNTKVDYAYWINNQWVKDFSRSNHLLYKEKTGAVYASVKKNTKNWDFELGVRSEQTTLSGVQLANDKRLRNNYIKFFPNVNISYNIDKKNNINFSYSKRINRPNYDDLNPFVYFVDSLFIKQGNAALQPAISNGVEITYAHNNWFSTTISHTHTNNIITAFMLQKPDSRTAIQAIGNIGTLTNWGVNTNITVSPFKWWTLNASINVFSNHYKQNKTTEPIDISYTAMFLNMTHTFPISKTIKAELTGYYKINEALGVFIYRPVNMIHAGFSKSILENRGSLKLSIRNIFYSQSWDTYNSQYAKDDSQFRVFTDSRMLTIAFAYKFGKQTVLKAKERVGASSQEQSRIM